jgi:hypothetical protein
MRDTYCSKLVSVAYSYNRLTWNVRSVLTGQVAVPKCLYDVKCIQFRQARACLKTPPKMHTIRTGTSLQCFEQFKAVHAYRRTACLTATSFLHSCVLNMCPIYITACVFCLDGLFILLLYVMIEYKSDILNVAIK